MRKMKLSTPKTEEKDRCPRVSVCCITYNHVNFIARALDGILNQEIDFTMEVLVYDDMSSDGTREIVERYSKLHPDIIKTVLPEENQYSKGVNTMAKLRELASGKYIAFCEGDDFWTDPTKLQQQVSFLEQNPRVVITGHKVIAVDIKGQPVRYFKSRNPFAANPQERDYTAEELRTLPVIIPTSSRVFRNIQLKMPLEAKKTIAGDAFLQVLLSEHGDYKYIDSIKPSYYMISNAGIWSQQSRDTEILQQSNLLTQLRLYLERKGYTKESGELYRQQSWLFIELLALRLLKKLGLRSLLKALKGKIFH